MIDFLVAMGETSEQARHRGGRVLGARLAPGAPLCRAISKKPHLADLQIALKGGQMGGEDYLVKALQGSHLEHVNSTSSI